MDQKGCEEDATITAQMLLVCAWRSVKKLSLPLGEMFLRLDVQSLIREEQVQQIGEHFSVLLTETKHGGAFEQAYVGFAKLCLRLWIPSDNVETRTHGMNVLRSPVPAHGTGRSSHTVFSRGYHGFHPGVQQENMGGT
ncbi:THADA [Carabus blaptoides fortunei]